MADDVVFQSTNLATPPDATIVAADDVGGIKYQKVKLFDPTADSTTALIGQKARTGSMPTALSTEDAALLADLLTNTNFQARIPTNGQKAMAGSVPVVIASDQSAIPISGTVTSTGGATEVTLSALNTKVATAKTADYDTGGGTDTVQMLGIALPASGGAAAGGTASNPVRTDPTGTTAQPVTDNGGSLTVDASSLPLPTGAATETTLGTRLSESDFDSRVGSLTETAPATDTASSGLNGRLQRIAQRITSLIALLPTALGQGTMAQSFRVVLPSDQAAIPVTVNSTTVTGTVTTKETRAATPSQSSVAGSASSVSLLASNANRLGATVYNDSTAILYLKLGATASATSHSVQMQAGSYYEVPFNYTGAIDGIWASATGSARITELAA